MKTISSMRKIAMLLPLVLGLAACGGNGSNPKNDSAKNKDSANAALKKDPRTLGGAKNSNQTVIDAALQSIRSGGDQRYGSWVGTFGDNKINLTISNISGDVVKGHSVCAGNFREVKGTISEKSTGVYAVTMNEPGTDPYDGKFEFELNTNTNQLSGSWTPFKAQGNKAKAFTLTKRDFQYSPNTGEHPETSTRLLKHNEVENLNADQLALLRCEIYARHGYCFKDKKMRAQFEAKEWYMPMSVDIRDQLTDIEARNIDLIYRYEDYYNENYGDYGR